MRSSETMNEVINYSTMYIYAGHCELLSNEFLPIYQLIKLSIPSSTVEAVFFSANQHIVASTSKFLISIFFPLLELPSTGLRVREQLHDKRTKTGQER